eukprot:5706866-Amphidinium_carterae.3
MRLCACRPNHMIQGHRVKRNQPSLCARAMDINVRNCACHQYSMLQMPQKRVRASIWRLCWTRGQRHTRPRPGAGLKLPSTNKTESGL